MCNMLQKVQFDECSSTLSQQFCYKSCPWLHMQRNIRKKCGGASASKNIPRVAAELTRTDKHLCSDTLLEVLLSETYKSTTDSA